MKNIEDTAVMVKSKLAFVAAMSEMEARAISKDATDEGVITNDVAWGRCYILEEIIKELDEAIYGQAVPAILALRKIEKEVA